MNSKLTLLGNVDINGSVYKVYLNTSLKHFKRISYRYKNGEFIVNYPLKILVNKEKVLKEIKEWGIKLDKKNRLIKESNDFIKMDEYNHRFIYILGKRYYLNENSEITFKNINIKVENKDIFYKRLSKYIYSDLETRFREYERKMDIPIKYNLKLKNTKTRYGSNSKKTNTIYLSYILFPYDLDIVTSTIIHELAHYYVFNHSKEFYKVINKYFKEYKKMDYYLKHRIYELNKKEIKEDERK